MAESANTQDLLRASLTSDVTNPFNRSILSSTSSSSPLQIHLSEAMLLSKVFTVWKKYSRQIASDRKLFVKLRDFIIRRLQRAGFNGLKVYYLQRQLSRYISQRRLQRMMSEVINGWKNAIQSDRYQEKQVSSIFQRIEVRQAFRSIKQHSFDALMMHIQNGKALKQWANCLERKAFQALQINIAKSQRRKENALKAYIYDEQRYKRLGLLVLRENRLWAKYLKRMEMRALRWFSKYYKRIALKSWLAFREYTRAKKELEFKGLQHSYKKDQKSQQQIFGQWKLVISSEKEDINTILTILERVLILRNGFNAIQEHSNEIGIQQELSTKHNCFKSLKDYREHRINRRIQRASGIILNEKFLKERAFKGFQDGLKIYKQATQSIINVLEKFQYTMNFYIKIDEKQLYSSI